MKEVGPTSKVGVASIKEVGCIKGATVRSIKVIAYPISTARAGFSFEEVSRPARPRDIPYAITFRGVR